MSKYKQHGKTMLTMLNEQRKNKTIKRAPYSPALTPPPQKCLTSVGTVRQTYPALLVRYCTYWRHSQM